MGFLKKQSEKIESLKKQSAKIESFTTKIAPTKNNTGAVHYPIDVVFWGIHTDAIIGLMNACGFDLNEGKISEYVKCKLVPEPKNEVDPNAVKVCAAPKGRGKEYYDIGYIPSEVAPYIRSDMQKVNTKSHFWSLRVNFDIINGVAFTLNLKESKY